MGSAEDERARIVAKTLAMALNPHLWSDDDETAHREASPVSVASLRAWTITRAEEVIENYYAIERRAHLISDHKDKEQS